MNLLQLTLFLTIVGIARGFTIALSLQANTDYSLNYNQTFVSLREMISSRLVFQYWMPRGCHGKRIGSRLRGTILTLDFPCEYYDDDYWSSKQH